MFPVVRVILENAAIVTAAASQEELMLLIELIAIAADTTFMYVSMKEREISQNQFLTIAKLQ